MALTSTLTPTLPAPNQQTLPKAVATAPIGIATVTVARAPANPLSLPRWLELWHLTSLDAPTVAVTWCLAFARSASTSVNPSAHIHLPWWLPTILALCTWSLYIADRLLDAHRERPLRPSEQNRVPQVSSLRPGSDTSLRKPGTAIPYSLFRSPSVPVPCTLQPRHHYHWTHRHLLLPAAIAATVAALALVWHDMPLAAQTRNSVLALASLAYLTSVHTPNRLRLPKELLVALVFTAACTLPTFTRTTHPFELTVPVLIFTALAWLNCQAIESWESNLAGKGIPRAAIALASAAAVLATITQINHHPRPALLIASAAISALFLTLLDKYKSQLTPTTLRTAADLALLTPILLLGF